MLRAKALPTPYVFAAVLVALACLRICFSSVLWSDEDYHMAMALDWLHGKVPYRDIWYDKPPLAAFYYLLIGAQPGILLRLWHAAYVLLCCWLAFRLARVCWGELEGRWAAFFVAFFTTFYLPAAVIPFAPDVLLIAPHLAAIYFAKQNKPWAAGLFCGLGFWLNVKALFVLAACLLWTPAAIVAFVLATTAGLAILAALGAFNAYLQQVWIWGFAYAPGSPVAHPVALAAGRIAHWLGFHLSLVLAWLYGTLSEQRTERLKLAAWLLISAAALVFGNHFAPRYFFQLLPPLVVVGGRGVTLALQHRPKLTYGVLFVLLMIPFARFAPRYYLMTKHTAWSDIALDQDARQAAAQINARKHFGDTLFVWGYRPDIYVLTRLVPYGKIWDSQPLTGVPADRHLTSDVPVQNAAIERNLAKFVKDRPTFFVDGLGLLNPKLQPQAFPAVAALLRHYREITRTRFCIIYRRADPVAQ